MTPTQKRAWQFVRLLNYRANIRRFMWMYRVTRVPPPQRYTFGGYGVLRTHERWFNASVPLELDQ